MSCYYLYANRTHVNLKWVCLYGINPFARFHRNIEHLFIKLFSLFYSHLHILNFTIFKIDKFCNFSYVHNIPEIIFFLLNTY